MKKKIHTNDCSACLMQYVEAAKYSLLTNDFAKLAA
jgi:hypothetical protein